MSPHLFVPERDVKMGCLGGVGYVIIGLFRTLESDGRQ